MTEEFDKITWKDIEDIAIKLDELHPDEDVMNLRFTALLDKILSIDGFEGAREECNEQKLEAVQQAWLEEKE